MTVTGKRAELLVEMHAAGGWLDVPPARLSTGRALVRTFLADDEGDVPVWGGLARRFALTSTGKAAALACWARLSRKRQAVALDLGKRQMGAGGVLAIFRCGPEGKVCPRCGCLPTGDGCRIDHLDGGSTGACVPAGVFDYTECSACQVDYVHDWVDGHPRCGAEPLEIQPATHAIRPPGPIRPRLCPKCNKETP